MSRVFVARLEDIPVRGARVVMIGEESIGVFRTSDDKVFALRDRCPHQSGPLSQGIVHDHCVTCPLHDWVIDLRSGNATGPDVGSTTCYPTFVENNRVYIQVAEADADLADTPDERAAVGQ